MSQDSQPSQEASTDGSQSPFPPANWVQDIVAPLPDRAAAFRAGWQAGIESMKDDYANGFDDGYDAGGEDERINREEQLKELENQNEDGTDSSEDESETIISTDAMDLDTSNDIDAAPINTPIGPSVTNVAPTIPDTTHAASVRQVPGRIYGSRIIRSHTRRTFVGNYKGWCQNCTALHRTCSSDRPACDRCVRQGKTCVYVLKASVRKARARGQA